MKQCSVYILDEVNCVINGLSKTHMDYFYDQFGIPAPNFFFSPKYKLGVWDGKIRYFSRLGATYVNLLEGIVPELIKFGYDLDLQDKRTTNSFPIPTVDANIFSHIKNPHTGEPMIIRDYQVELLTELFKYGNGIAIAATGSGKTLISAGLALGYEKAAGFKSIIIVPDKNLTEQTRSEYEFFGLDVGEYSGSRKDYDKQHIVATWQTLQNNPNYIQNFQVVICDECQGLRGNTISKLLNEYGKNIPVRFGLTGTLPKEPADALAIKIAVGDVRYTIPAHKLIKQQYLSDLKIDIVQLETNLKQEYEKHIFDTPTSTISYKDFKEQYIPDFSAEQRYVQADNARIDWIAKDIEQRPGNTLCLVSNIKFGKKLTKAIDGAIFLYGKDEMKVRKQVYELFKDNDNIKVIANLQIASTGLNIPRIFNLYLIDIGKSFVRTIQSIGRGLRKAHDKDFVNVVDICSDLKYSNRHMKNRMKYYTEAKYPFEHRKVKYKH